MTAGGGIGTITAAVATYNGARTVAETLAAILGQTRKPDEVIVVDDGSTDGTLRVLEAFGDRIRVIRIDNSGPEVAKKTAIEAATGDWVALSDHDDLWRPDHLARLEALVRAYPESDFAFGNFAEFGTAALYDDKFASMGDAYWRDAGTVDENGFRFIGRHAFPMLLKGNPFFPSAGLFRRALYDRVGGIRPRFSYNVSGDIDMTRRFALAGNLACDHRVTVDIRKDGSNYSAGMLRAAMDRLAILQDHIAEGGVYAPHRAALEAAAEAAAVEAMEAAFYARDRSAFRTAARQVPFMALPWGLRLRSLFLMLPIVPALVFWLYDRLTRGRQT